MSEQEHVHKYQTIDKNNLICNSCNTVTPIDILLENTEKAARKSERIKVLSDQLFARELKKDAHDKAYAWIMQNTGSAPAMAGGRQEMLI